MRETHKSSNIGWLRAAVLGANDGIISTASLISGVAASKLSINAIMIAGIAGLVAGAFSMAAGEYVSVSSQSDTEKADLEKEKEELRTMPEEELIELTNIYVNRGLDKDLAKQVAVQLTEKDALKAHLRDELGITELSQSKPFQAAVVSALCFSVGAALPLLVAWLTPITYLLYSVFGFSIFSLALLGSLASFAGGASMFKGACRVTFWGAIAMLCTIGIGSLFEVSIV